MIKRFSLLICVYYAVVCAYGLTTRPNHYPKLDVGWAISGKINY